MAAKKFNLGTNSLSFNITGTGNPTTGYADNQIVEIPNNMIIENDNQCFSIHDDTIKELAQHIAKDGQLSPCIVSPLSDGTYELIDGRHRRRAVILAGIPTTKCVVRTGLTNNQKKTIRLTTNLIRNNDYSPSELAFAYKELFELEGNMQKISDETNLNKKKIYRYIRLTNLIKPLLKKVDSSDIPLIAGVELSYLTKEEQGKLFEFLLNHAQSSVTTEIAHKLKSDFSKLESIFNEAETETEPEKEEVDKLSTSDEDNKDSKPSTDESGAASDCDEQIDTSAAKKIILRIFLEITKADEVIIGKFFSTAEFVKYIKTHFRNLSSYSPSLEYDFTNTGFHIRLKENNKGDYLIKYTELDRLTRENLRKEYSTEQIKDIISNCRGSAI